ncbi:MAG TPA: hypothetical protein ENJ87_05955, partial [Gammaproteobacteria bacterium]|nr:hypothetical protein [Gammaproteobacteria bacterium]
EWLLNAGDMLYLPPNVAHHGIAQDHKNKEGEEEHCLTASVGFRAPSVKTMVNDYIHFITESKQNEVRYRDNAPTRPEHHAEISEETVSQFIDYLEQGISIKREQVKQWLGQYCSDNKAFEGSCLDDQHVHYDELPDSSPHSRLIQSPYSHFLFSHSGQTSLLFVDGISYPVSKMFAEMICEDDQIDYQQLDNHATDGDRTVLLTLFNTGSLILSGDS